MLESEKCKTQTQSFVLQLVPYGTSNPAWTSIIAPSIKAPHTMHAALLEIKKIKQFKKLQCIPVQNALDKQTLYFI